MINESLLKSKNMLSISASFVKESKIVLKKMEEEQEDDGSTSPPIDIITVTTSSVTRSVDEDNDSCCSSISCELADEPEDPHSIKPRPIFGDYWVTQGYSASPFYRSGPRYITAPPSSICFVSSENSGPFYPVGDHLVVFQEETRARQKLERRAIFGSAHSSSLQQQQHLRNNNNNNNNNTKSQSSDLKLLAQLARAPKAAVSKSAAQSDLQLLAELAHNKNCTLVGRKTQSAPVFGLRSALKPSRYSGNGNNANNGDGIKRSVSFRNQVDVAIISSLKSPLVEQYAQDGWTQWFA